MHDISNVTLKIIYLKIYIFSLAFLKVKTRCPTTNRHKTNKYKNKNSRGLTTRGRPMRKNNLVIVHTITIQTATRL